MSGANFYTNLPPKAQFKFFAAIFFTFAPVFLLGISQFAASRPWTEILFYMLGSGLIAVSYAYAGIFNHKLFAVAIGLQVLFAIVLGAFFGKTNLALSIEGIVCVAFVVLGYILFISFINGEGVKTLRLKTEMDLAQQVHAHLVPRIDLTLPWIEVSGEAMSSTEVGGDLIDVLQQEDRVGLFIADVSGHGVKAGVLMSMVKSAVRMKQLHSRSLDDLCIDLNRVVHQVKRPEMFVTFACVQIGKDRKVEYIIAGHPPILHFRRASNTIDELFTRSPGLGLIPDYTYTVQSLQADEGDCFILITDGLFEVTGKNVSHFGLEGIKQTVLKNRDLPLEELKQEIIKAARAHGTQDDDQTLLLAQIGKG